MRIQSVKLNRQTMHLPRKFLPLVWFILHRPPFFTRKNGRIGTASVLVLEQEQHFIRGGGTIVIGGGKWGQRGREVGAEGEGSGDKGGGKWESGTPLSTPSNRIKKLVRKRTRFFIGFTTSLCI